MEDFTKKCFVCEKPVEPKTASINSHVNLPVCSDCKGTPSEKEKVNDLLEGLAERFVCGCI